MTSPRHSNIGQLKNANARGAVRQIDTEEIETEALRGGGPKLNDLVEHDYGAAEIAVKDLSRRRDPRAKAAVSLLQERLKPSNSSGGP